MHQTLFLPLLSALYSRVYFVRRTSEMPWLCGVFRGRVIKLRILLRRMLDVWPLWLWMGLLLLVACLSTIPYALQEGERPRFNIKGINYELYYALPILFFLRIEERTRAKRRGRAWLKWRWLRSNLSSSSHRSPSCFQHHTLFQSLRPHQKHNHSEYGTASYLTQIFGKHFTILHLEMV